MNEGIKIKYRINRSCFIGCSEICNNKEDLNEIIKQYKKNTETLSKYVMQL